MKHLPQVKHPTPLLNKLPGNKHRRVFPSRCFGGRGPIGRQTIRVTRLNGMTGTIVLLLLVPEASLPQGMEIGVRAISSKGLTISRTLKPYQPPPTLPNPAGSGYAGYRPVASQPDPASAPVILGRSTLKKAASTSDWWLPESGPKPRGVLLELTKTQTLKCLDSSVTRLAFSPDGTWLVAIRGRQLTGSQLLVWRREHPWGDFLNGPLLNGDSEDFQFEHVAFTDNTGNFITVGSGGQVASWRLSTEGNFVLKKDHSYILEAETTYLASALSQDGTHLAMAWKSLANTYDKGVTYWRFRDGMYRWVGELLSTNFTGRIVCTPDGTRFITSCSNKTIEYSRLTETDALNLGRPIGGTTGVTVGTVLVLSSRPMVAGWCSGPKLTLTGGKACEP